VVERPQIQNDEHEEVIPSNVKGGAPHPPRGHDGHDGHTGHEDQENPKVTDESVNFDKCAAVQTRAMKQRELKTPKPLKVRSIDGLDIGPEQLIEQHRTDEDVFELAAAIACVIEDNSTTEEDTGATIKDADLLSLYNVQQKEETFDDVDINPELSEVQCAELKQLLKEYKQMFSDVPTVTHLAEHKVELTQSEPVKCKMYPTPYKMQAVVDRKLITC